jgi:tetrahydromethanopterin S-methyltransferase subunit B
MKRLQTVGLSLAAIIGLATMGAGVINAQSTTKHNPLNGLVNAIAQKFNLDPAAVQQVVDAQHAQMESEMHAQRATEQKTKLNQAVKDGKITQAQEDLIIAKQTEIQAFMESLKDKTPAEREAAMKIQKDTLKTWATQNNIPEQYIMGFGPGGRGKHGMPKFGGERNPSLFLDQAVKNGKITQAQADLIIAKHAELKTTLESLKDKTPEERQAAMEAQRENLKKWATDNNLSEQFTMFFGGHGMGGGKK